MRRTNKIISFVLAMIMLLSSVSLSLFASAEVDLSGLLADPANGITQGYVTDNGNATNSNTTVLFDWLDSILKDIDLKDLLGETADSVIKLCNSIGITININSINGILETLDTVKSVNIDVRRSFLGTKRPFTEDIFGDGYGLNTKNWPENQSREKTGDYAVLCNFIQFLSDNSAFLGGFVANKTNDKYSIPIVGDISVPTMSSLLSGKDIYTFVKETVAGLIYEKGSEKYNAAVNKTLDKIVFEDALGDGLNGLLIKLDDWFKGKFVKENPTSTMEKAFAYLYGEAGFKFEGSLDGYVYNENMTLDATVTDIIKTIFTNNADVIKKLLMRSGDKLYWNIVDNEWGKPFASIIKLDVLKADDESKVAYIDEMGKALKDSLTSFNDFAGILVEALTTYKWDYDKSFGENYESIFMWSMDVARKATVAEGENNPYAVEGYKEGNFQSYALTLAKIIVNRAVDNENDPFRVALNKCTTTQEVVTNLLKLISFKENGEVVKVIGDKSTTYKQVLGDILGYYLNKVAILYTDTKNTQRYQVGSGKTYLDVLNYAANYYLCDLNFATLMGAKLTKNMTFVQKLDALQVVLFNKNNENKTGNFKFDYSTATQVIEPVVDALINLDIEKLFRVGFEEAFTDKNTTVSAANLVYGMINNLLIGAVGTQVFDSKFISLDNMIKNDTLEGVVKKLLTGLNNRKAPLLSVALYLFNALSDQSYFEATIDSTVQANGKNHDGNVKVINKYTGKELKKGTDYTVTSTAKIGNAKVTVTGKGDYIGSVVLNTNIVCNNHKQITKVTKAATYTSTGTKVYCCEYCGKQFKTETIPVLVPGKVGGLKVSSVKSSAIVLTWNKVNGAAKYEVQYSADGKKWTTVTTKTNSITITKLSGTKTYQFKVRAVSGANKYGAFSSVVKSTVLPGKVTGLKASKIKKDSLKLSWKKVSDATKYEVYMSTDGKKWTKVATTTETSVTVKNSKTFKIAAGKKYQVKVRAVSKLKKNGEYSAVLKTGTQTNAVKNVKLKSSKSKQVNVTWSKATGAKQYIVQYTTDKNFKKNVKSTTVTSTKATLKKLSGGKKLYVKVIAVNAYGVKSSASSVVNIKVKK